MLRGFDLLVTLEGNLDYAEEICKPELLKNEPKLESPFIACDRKRR